MIKTSITVEELMQALISELGFKDTCTCCSGGKQWYLRDKAASFASREKETEQKLRQTQIDFLAFLKGKGANIQKLTENQHGLNGFKLSDDGTRLRIYGERCFTLRELCEAIAKAIE